MDPFRPDPRKTERMLRQARAALEALAPKIHLAVRLKPSGFTDCSDVPLYAPAQDLARLGALDGCLEPYPCEVRAGFLRTLRGTEAVVFSLGHQDPGHFVLEVMGLLRRAGQRGAAVAASGKPCECAGAIELPPGAWSYGWWLPPDVAGAFVSTWTPGLPTNEAAVPVTQVILHASLAMRVAEVLKLPARGGAS